MTVSLCRHEKLREKIIKNALADGLLAFLPMLEQMKVIRDHKRNKIFVRQPFIGSIAASVQSNNAKWVYGIIFAENRKLVGADDELRQEFVGQTVEVSPVELSFWPSLEVCFMLRNMSPHFCHGFTDGDVVVE